VADEDEFIEEIRKETDTPVYSEEKSPEPNLLYEMKELQGCFNSEASRMLETLKSVREMILDQAYIAIKVLYGSIEPGIVDKVFNPSDLDSRTKGRSAIDKELK
jgi:hypothetical protein